MFKIECGIKILMILNKTQTVIKIVSAKAIIIIIFAVKMLIGIASTTVID